MHNACLTFKKEDAAMMTPYSQTVKLLIQHICKENDISRKKLSQILAYSSATSMDRLAQGKGGEKATEDLIGRIEHSVGHIQLTQEDQEILREIRRSMRSDDSDAWLRILGLTENEEKESFIVVENGENILLEQYVMSHMPKEMNIFGCLSGYLIRSLQRCPVSFSVRHYLYMHPSDREGILRVETVFPMFFSPNYSFYLLDQKYTEGVETGYPGHLMNFIHLKSEASVLLLLIDEKRAMAVPIEENMSLDACVRNTIGETAAYQKQNFHAVNTEGDYLRYLDYICCLENRHAIYRFKADIGLELISYEIQSRALREGDFTAVHPEMKANIPAVIDIEKKRYIQSMQKRRQIHIMTDTMWTFVRTGKISDHFWGMRPFTMEERKRILTELIGRCRGQPGFQVRFLKRKMETEVHEVICYENTGICFIPKSTDYNLENGYTEIITQNREMISSYIRFFMEKLLPEYTYSEEKSIQILEKMIDALSNLGKMVK